MIELDREARLRLLISVITVLLFYSVLQNNWYEIRGQGEFTMGPPKESKLNIVYEIGAVNEDGAFEISRSTPFLKWMANRESRSNQTSSSEGTNSERQSGEEISATDYVRYGIKIAGILLILILSIRIFHDYPHMLKFSFFVWLIGILLFTIGIPLSLSMDNGGEISGGDTPVEEPTPDTVEFHFFNVSSDMKVIFGGIQYNFNASGYDSGLLSQEEIDQLNPPPPEEGDVGYEEFVAFEGHFSLKPSKAFNYWFIIPLIWLIEVDWRRLREAV